METEGFKDEEVLVPTEINESENDGSEEENLDDDKGGRPLPIIPPGGPAIPPVKDNKED